MLKIDDEVARLKNAAIPPNVKAIHNNDVLQWKEEDRFFHECHNFPDILEKVKNKPHVTFVGVPGSGKTATAHHIALMLQQEGYDIVPIKDIRDREIYCDPRNPQVFLIDDVVGVFGLQETKLNLLSDYQDRIMKPVMSKSKTLMTCREVVYRKTIESSSFFTDENNIVLLHSEANSLNHTDKQNILKMYNIDVNLLSSASLSRASKMFPYLCKLFSTDKKFQQYGSAFFVNPVPCILTELDEMKKQNKLHYASLVLCLMNENKISKKFLETENETVRKHSSKIKHRVLEKCKVNHQTDIFEFIDALSEMEGTYTKLCGTEYRFIHDSMFEIVAHHFGCHFPELILQFMSSSYIANSVKLQKCEKQEFDNGNKQVRENVVVSDERIQEGEKAAVSNEISDDMESFDLCIRLKENQYPILAKRLYTDIENMELYDVFMNDVLKHPKFCQAFIGVLKTKSYTELKTLFLSVQKDVSKVVSKRKDVQREIEERDEMIDEWFKQEVLMNERRKGEPRYSVRVITWVVYYGHNQVLQYILEQTESKKETQSELFWNCFNPGLSYTTKLEESNIETNNVKGVSCLLNPISGSSNQKQDINPSISEKYRLLVLGCYSGDLETVRILLKNFNENIINKAKKCSAKDYIYFDTPLMAACGRGHLSVVKQLLKKGADINLQGKFHTPLVAACFGGHMSVVKELIEAGADVNLECYENTPLTATCQDGHLSIMKELLEAGADVNPEGNFNTPLTRACLFGHMKLVKELIEAGADVNLKDVEDTPLIAACKSGDKSVVKKLLKAGADINLQGKYDTPLTVACAIGQMSVVKQLMKAGAFVNMQNSKGQTPLYTMFLKDTETLIPVAKMVNCYGADPTVCDIEGLSALGIALAKSKVHAVKQLFQMINKSQVNKLKLHLFDSLVIIRHCDVMTDSKDDVETQGHMWRINEKGGLYNTIRQSKCEVLKRLLGLGVDVNRWIQLFGGVINDLKGPVPLLFTVIDDRYITDRVEKVRILLKSGVDINARVRYKECDSFLYRERVSYDSRNEYDGGKDLDVRSVLDLRSGSNDSIDEDDEEEEDLEMTSVFDIGSGSNDSSDEDDGEEGLDMTSVPDKRDGSNYCSDEDDDEEEDLAMRSVFDIGSGSNDSSDEDEGEEDLDMTSVLDIRSGSNYSSDEDDGEEDLDMTSVPDKRGGSNYSNDGDDEGEEDIEMTSVLDRGSMSNDSGDKDEEGEGLDMKFVIYKDDMSKNFVNEDDKEDGNLDMRSVLDREGVSVLERTQQLVSKLTKSERPYLFMRHQVPEYKRVLSELKKHVRRYSV